MTRMRLGLSHILVPRACIGSGTRMVVLSIIELSDINLVPRDDGTTGAAGAVAFCLDNFTGALRVQNKGAAERV